jgi:hypothetical protein
MGGWNAKALKDMPTIHQGQCCDCKVDSGGIRVWLCRVGGGVTVEQYKPESGRWESVSGGCQGNGEED